MKALYGRFAAAQNARDLAAVKALLIDSPDFLWVSDGKSVWGRDALVERMGRFQTLEVWHVEPLLDRARVVAVSEDVAYLHMPLDLHLGGKSSAIRHAVSREHPVPARGRRLADRGALHDARQPVMASPGHANWIGCDLE